jgi:hypothetical protein
MFGRRYHGTGRDPVELALEHHYLALAGLEERRYEEAERNAVTALRMLTSAPHSDPTDIDVVMRTVAHARALRKKRCGRARCASASRRC